QMMSKYSKINKSDVASQDLQQAYLPIYGTVQYCFKTSSKSIAPFVKLNLGYNMYSINSKLKDAVGDPEAGIYYAIGGGAVISKNINVTLLYSSYTAALKKTGGNLDVASTSIGLFVGYVFDLCCGK
ncbi:MAG: hypothetical protein NT145_09000, partial [Elusimicrobia bacterium]|nr:hypothetical protein [Elusimicrobiota bacterium]